MVAPMACCRVSARPGRGLARSGRRVSGEKVSEGCLYAQQQREHAEENANGGRQIGQG